MKPAWIDKGEGGKGRISREGEWEKEEGGKEGLASGNKAKKVVSRVGEVIQRESIPEEFWSVIILRRGGKQGIKGKHRKMTSHKLGKGRREPFW